MIVGGGGTYTGGGSSGKYDRSAQQPKNGTIGGRGRWIGGRCAGGRNAGRMPLEETTPEASTEPTCAQAPAGASTVASDSNAIAISRAMPEVYSRRLPLDNEREGRFPDGDG